MTGTIVCGTFACMPPPNRGYIDGVDRLLEETPLDLVLTHFGLLLPEKMAGEHRMPCCFSDGCSESSYGSLTVNLTDPAKVIYCHSYGVRGNLLTLIHGLSRHRPPATGKLRGMEFKESVEILQRIRGLLEAPQASPRSTTPLPEAVHSTQTREPARNAPLQDQEKTRNLVNLWEDLVVDPAVMPPPAARYFRKRPWLSPDICRHWKMGYLPRDGRSLFRGMIVYAHSNEAGQILTYSARDPAFSDKWADWIRDGRPEKSRPSKHRWDKLESIPRSELGRRPARAHLHATQRVGCQILRPFVGPCAQDPPGRPRRPISGIPHDRMVYSHAPANIPA